MSAAATTLRGPAMSGTRAASLPPGPRGLPLIGATSEFTKNRLHLLLERRQRYGDIVRSSVAGHELIQISSASGVQRVLQMNSKNYVKSRIYNIIKPVTGDGLVNSEGAFWRRQRKIAQPSFHKQRLSVFTRTMARAIDDQLDRWQPRAESGQSFDVHRDLNGLALRIVGETLFSTDMGADVENIGETLERAMKLYEMLFPVLLVAPDWTSPETWPIPGASRVKKTLDDIVYGFVKRRRKGSGSYDDLLDMFMNAVDEDGAPLTDKQVRDEMMTMVLAGHETTAVAMSWAMYVLAAHGDVQQRVRQEAASLPTDRPPTLDDVARLDYTSRVVHETMRLYPPAWGFGRAAVDDDVIDGYRIRAGSLIQVVPWAVHRNPRYWDRPEVFDPDRFLPKNKERRHKYAYIPFGAGPRLCIGARFSVIEATLALAKASLRYRIDVAPGARIEPKPSLSLRPKRGMPLVLSNL